MNEAEDIAWIQQCLGGDRRAFEPLVTKYEKVVYNAAFRIVNNAEDAQDITQSCFIKAYENLRSYDPAHKFFSWIYRIALNESLNAVRGRRDHEPVHDNLLSHEKSPEELYHDQELKQNIERCIMSLKLDHRIVIILSHFQHLSYSEIGFVLDLPEKTVKSRLFTARQTLKDIVMKKQVLNG
jgi:RNA polymerase sigma-70 factor (ECF subfamily)